MRSLAVVFAACSLVLVVDAALALQPCPESCHLGQGQPLLLADLDVVLMTRCDWNKGKSGSPITCVTEELALDGTVRKKLPSVPSGMGSDREFTSTYLEGHRLVGLGWQPKFSPLDKPYVLNELFTNQRLTLTLEKSTLRCTAPGLPMVTRDFGCLPSEVRVFATMSSEKVPQRPVIIVGVCRPDANSTREVVVACTAAAGKR